MSCQKCCHDTDKQVSGFALFPVPRPCPAAKCYSRGKKSSIVDRMVGRMVDQEQVSRQLKAEDDLLNRPELIWLVLPTWPKDSPGRCG